MFERPNYLPYETKEPSLGGLADEEKARCIWCGEWYYKIHHRDGVCHPCLEEGRATITQLQVRVLLLRIATLIVILGLIATLFSGCSVGFSGRSFVHQGILRCTQEAHGESLLSYRFDTTRPDTIIWQEVGGVRVEFMDLDTNALVSIRGADADKYQCVPYTSANTN